MYATMLKGENLNQILYLLGECSSESIFNAISYIKNFNYFILIKFSHDFRFGKFVTDIYFDKKI